MSRQYTKEEKASILEELNIQPLNGMLNSRQVAQIWTKRAEIEFEQQHVYDDNSVRWRVKSNDLSAVSKIHNRMNLFDIDDVFSIELMPQKGRKPRGRDQDDQSLAEAA